jgi:hypothetical protein
MSIKKWIATSTVALGLLSGGVALSAGASADTAPPAGGDTDNVQEQVQEGDQTAADDGTESESVTESDGPGGNADPAGNVDHQFEGEE